jgi:hypothetical protein
MALLVMLLALKSTGNNSFYTGRSKRFGSDLIYVSSAEIPAPRPHECPYDAFEHHRIPCLAFPQLKHRPL